MGVRCGALQPGEALETGIRADIDGVVVAFVDPVEHGRLPFPFARQSAQRAASRSSRS
jgi:hypothetical protein